MSPVCLHLAVLAWAATTLAQPHPDQDQPIPALELFFDAASTDDKRARAAVAALEGVPWTNGYTAMVVDLARLRPRPRFGFEGEESPPAAPDGSTADPAFARPEAGGGPRPPSAPARARERLVRLLRKRTGLRFGHDLDRWRRHVWSATPEPHPRYAEFKARLYGAVDARMATFFDGQPASRIRLDEIDWGGVGVDGIPPLDHPRTLPAAEASYLNERDVVFGVFLNGEARAYPKRILAWHELALDTLGGVELVVVYCTLCGTVVPYGSDVAGRRLTFGTSGLLYRSNKLMFDAQTATLWSSTEGRPVVGPLVGTGLELRAYPVVTSTWAAWRALHPETTVLSLDTGHRRDYAEGAAYRAYFASDEPMFAVAHADGRLKNKAEVLGLISPPPGEGGAAPRRSLAVSVERLRREPLLHLAFDGRELLVVTTPDGANRVYTSGAMRFERLEAGTLRDAGGGAWRLTEDALASGDQRLPRFAARRAFWFGWYAQFPETGLVH